MRLVLIGPPGSGKGTQAQAICRHFGVIAIATGDMLRAAVSQGSDLGLEAKRYMDSGALVPDHLIVDMMRVRVSDADARSGFLLDGFPRTVPQAEALVAAGLELDVVLEVAVPDEEILKRMSGRRIHPASGRSYHVLYQPPKVADRDDVTGEALVIREDDREETVKKRLQVYHQQTAPVLAFYRQRQALGHSKPRLAQVAGVGPVAQIEANILAELKKVSTGAG